MGGYLSEVELSILLVRDALNLKKGSVGTGVTLAALMTEYAPFAVESVGETGDQHLVAQLILTTERVARECHPDPTESIHHILGCDNPHSPSNKKTTPETGHTYRVDAILCP